MFKFIKSIFSTHQRSNPIQYQIPNYPSRIQGNVL